MRRFVKSAIKVSEMAQYVTAKDVELDLPISKSKKAPESSSGAIFANSSFQTYLSTQPSDSYLSDGASVGRAGGAGGN